MLNPEVIHPAGCDCEHHQRERAQIELERFQSRTEALTSLSVFDCGAEYGYPFLDCDDLEPGFQVTLPANVDAVRRWCKRFLEVTG